MPYNDFQKSTLFLKGADYSSKRRRTECTLGVAQSRAPYIQLTPPKQSVTFFATLLDAACTINTICQLKWAWRISKLPIFGNFHRENMWFSEGICQSFWPECDFPANSWPLSFMVLRGTFNIDLNKWKKHIQWPCQFFTNKRFSYPPPFSLQQEPA